MKKFFAVTYILLCTFSFAQESIDVIFDKIISYRGLTRKDITIPVDFFSSAEKSPTNDVKLVLPLVRDMMVNPLMTMNLADGLDSIKDKDLYATVYKIMQFNMNTYEQIFQYYGLWFPRIAPLYLELEKPSLSLSDKIWYILKKSKYFNDTLSLSLTNSDKEFLNKNILSILEESENDDNSNFNIFEFNKARDSSILKSKKTMDILSKVNYSLVDYGGFNSFSMCNNIYKYSKDSLQVENLSELKYYNNKYIQGDFYYYYDQDSIRIAIGGHRHNEYHGRFDFIIDVGGDDYYNIERDKSFNNNFSCIIDLSGNDYYSTSSDFALAGALFSSSFIFDKSGDDIYESKGYGNLGAAIGGLGLLYDVKGNDTYKGLSFSIGAGCFGVGLLIDREGNDFYIANSYSQGFGMTEGVGCIIDNKGNDSYLIDSRSLDIGRYNDHYVSMCQGYGLGLRPYYGGGIGLIIEGEGNDIYNTDIFGQGGGYWYGLGAIVDKSGHDKYNGYQYSQGSGIHLAVGLLKDYDGWDFYSSNGVSQGCGHDFGFGMLYDVKGNDNYSAYSLSQGAGNANGIGILIDESGVDGYLNKFPSNTRGYGNSRREFGSIGIFLDASGDDYYSQQGFDSTLNSSSQWGVFADYYLKDLPEQLSGDNFKVPIDTINRPHDIKFSLDELFVMAKTIEPRFSLWQEYGFNSLVRESIQTSGYILSKLGSDDHRDAQVLRLLALKIPESINASLKEFLQRYLNGYEKISFKEVSFACYLIGETRNPAAKEMLYELMLAQNFRVRSNAINALGKIKLEDSDALFKEKASSRLLQLALEDSDKRLYIKDIAFALSNYPGQNSMLAAIHLLKNEYYGARFLASECLKSYGEDYYQKIIESNLTEQINENYLLKNFANSIQQLDEKKFKQIIETLLSKFGNDEIGSMILAESVKLRRTKSTEHTFTKWCDDVTGNLSEGLLWRR